MLKIVCSVLLCLILCGTSTAQSTAQKIVTAGTQMLRRPYVAGVLNENGLAEQLIIDTMRLDCWTFTEYCLARALSDSDASFYQQVQKLRYRNGSISGYGSRIHYFSEWAIQAEESNLLTNLSQKLGGIKDKRVVHFMSSNRAKYPLYTSGRVQEEIQSAEKRISNRPRYYIPKAQVDRISKDILSGDIIGIATNVSGLDFSHQGIAVKQNGKLYLMHASSERGKVVVTRETLSEYLAKHKKHIGIVVLRPN